LPDNYFSSCYIQNIKKSGAKRLGNSSTDHTPSRAANCGAVRDKQFERIVNNNLSFNFNDTKSKFFTQTSLKSAAPRRTQARKAQQHRDTSPTDNDILLTTTATPKDRRQGEKKKSMRRLLAAQPKTNPY
jgi:hypothetical protein